jgi:hypothetical protein
MFRPVFASIAQPFPVRSLQIECAPVPILSCDHNARLQTRDPRRGGHSIAEIGYIAGVNIGAVISRLVLSAGAEVSARKTLVSGLLTVVKKEFIADLVPLMRATTRILFSLRIGRAQARTISAHAAAILTSRTRRGGF